MKLRPFFLAVVLFAVCVAIAPAQEQGPLPPLRVHFVDVGQGDGIFIRTPTGQTVVYDAGEDPIQMCDYITRNGVGEIGLVIASHNHADHIAGIAEVVRLSNRVFTWTTGFLRPLLTQAKVLQAVSSAGSQLLEPTDRRIALGDVSVHVIPPPGIPIGITATIQSD